MDCRQCMSSYTMISKYTSKSANITVDRYTDAHNRLCVKHISFIRNENTKDSHAGMIYMKKGIMTSYIQRNRQLIQRMRHTEYRDIGTTSQYGNMTCPPDRPYGE